MVIIHKSNKGFTLLEILIVVVILAALTALAIPAYTSTTEKAKKQEVFSILTSAREAQLRYYMSNNKFTDDGSELDFDPNGTMTGSTPNYTYTFGTTGSTAFTITGEKKVAGVAGGKYTVKIDQDGTITSNF